MRSVLSEPCQRRPVAFQPIRERDLHDAAGELRVGFHAECAWQLPHELGQVDLAGDFDVAGIGRRGERSRAFAGELDQIRDNLQLLDVELVAGNQHIGLAGGDVRGQRVAPEQRGRSDKELRRGQLPQEQVLRLAVVGPDVSRRRASAGLAGGCR